MKRYEVSQEVREDNEMNNAVLHATITDRKNTEQKIDDAKKGRAAHDIQALMRYKNGLDVEIGEHMQTSTDFYNKNRDELHGEAFNQASDEGLHITVEQPETLAEVIPIHRAAAGGHVPAEIPLVAAQK